MTYRENVWMGISQAPPFQVNGGALFNEIK